MGLTRHQEFTICKLFTDSKLFNLYVNSIAVSSFYQRKTNTEKWATLPKVTQLNIVELVVELGQSDSELVH